MKRPLRVLFFPFGDIRTGSSRMRAFFVAEEFRRLGAEVRICGRHRLSRLPNLALKFAGAVRWLPWCDILFFNKAAHPLTYPVLRLARALGKKVVFDVDDAEFLGRHGAWFDRFFREADLVVAGSHYVLEHARRLNRASIWIPTSVQLGKYALKRSYLHPGPVVIGWTGVASGLPYLAVVRAPLERLARRHDIELRVISNWAAAAPFKPPAGVAFTKVAWDLATANVKLAEFDIGLMPLEDTPWARGKCAFKAVEYMASGVPAAISRVGENAHLVQDGRNGFLAGTGAEWERKLERLIRDPALRERIGRAGRRTIMRRYDLRKNSALLFKHLLRLRQP
jgi:hypothetical protein